MKNLIESTIGLRSQDASNIRLLRLKVFAGHNLAKKDIFGASDPYVRIDLIRNADDSVIDSVYTKTKKKVFSTSVHVSKSCSRCRH